MDNTPNKYITVAYKLYVVKDGKKELIEEATAENPFQFISGMGTTLETFEGNVEKLNAGDTFDFTIPSDEAYGPYEEDRVIELAKENFMQNGKFPSEHVFTGAYIPLVNEDGNRFQGLVVEIKDDAVVIDLNSRLAGQDLTFEGNVIESRPATNEEIQGMLNMISGEGGCNCDGCGGDCDDHDHEGGCCGGGCH